MLKIDFWVSVPDTILKVFCAVTGTYVNVAFCVKKLDEVSYPGYSVFIFNHTVDSS